MQATVYQYTIHGCLYKLLLMSRPQYPHGSSECFFVYSGDGKDGTLITVRSGQPGHPKGVGSWAPLDDEKWNSLDTKH